jgi:hypothetical protein
LATIIPLPKHLFLGRVNGDLPPTKNVDNFLDLLTSNFCGQEGPCTQGYNENKVGIEGWPQLRVGVKLFEHPHPRLGTYERSSPYPMVKILLNVANNKTAYHENVRACPKT